MIITIPDWVIFLIWIITFIGIILENINEHYEYCGFKIKLLIISIIFSFVPFIGQVIAFIGFIEFIKHSKNKFLNKKLF
jgi:hypothetical protein